MTDWPIAVPLQVLWGDQDALGHANNARYFTWFESARIALFDAVGLPCSGPALPAGPILAKIDCTFREPLHYPARITACCRVTQLGTTSFVVRHAVLLAETGGEVAFGDGVCVLIDYRSGAKVPLPHDLRARLEAHR